MDPVMIRPPGIDNGAFVLSPESVWYARVLLLFSASSLTDTGSKSFDCALVSTLETYNDPENGNYVYYTYYYNYYNYLQYVALMHIIAFIAIIVDCFVVEWLESVGSRVVYELDYKKPIMYIVTTQNILGKLPVVPVSGTGTISHRMRNAFPGAPGDRRQGAGDGCRMWFVNSWAS